MTKRYSIKSQSLTDKHTNYILLLDSKINVACSSKQNNVIRFMNYLIGNEIFNKNDWSSKANHESKIAFISAFNQPYPYFN